MARRWLTLLACTLVLAACGGDDDGGPAAIVHGPESPFNGSIMPPGVKAPQFTLEDENGEPLRMRDAVAQGPVIVTFLYSTCVEECPLLAQQVRGALDDLGHDVPAIAISVDPKVDTRASVKRFLRRQRVAGRLKYARGSAKELAPVWKGFAIQPQKIDAEHQARIVLVDRKGLQRVGYPGGQGTPEQIAADIELLERGE